MSDKKGLSESDICDRYITPALDRAGWTSPDGDGFLYCAQDRSVEERVLLRENCL